MGVVVTHYADRTEAQVTAAVTDRVARAFLIADPEMRTMALDFNARLVTELRLSGIWPSRYQPHGSWRP